MGLYNNRLGAKFGMIFLYGIKVENKALNPYQKQG